MPTAATSTGKYSSTTDRPRPWHPNFLLPYWLLLTAALFLCKPLSGNTARPTAAIIFSSLNNALFFLLFAFDFGTRSFIDPLWPFAAILGSALVGLSLFIQNTKSHSTATADSFLAQGIALLTYALCLWLTGPSLVITLAIQAITLTAMFNKNKNPILGIGSAIAFALSVTFLIIAATTTPAQPWLYFSVTAIYLSHTALLKQSFRHLTHLTDIPKELAQIPATLAVITTAAAIMSIDIAMEYRLLPLLCFTLLYSSTLLSRKLSKTFAFLPFATHLLTVTAFALTIESPGLPPLFYLCSSTILAGISTIQFMVRKKNHGLIHPIYFTLTHLSILLFLFTGFNTLSLIIPLSLIPMLYHLAYKKIHSKSFIVLGLLTYLPAWLIFNLSQDFGTPAGTLSTLICLSAPLFHYAILHRDLLPNIPYTSGYLVTGSTLTLATWLHSISAAETAGLILSAVGLAYIVFEEKDRFNTLTITGGLLLIINFLSLTSQQSPLLERYLVIVLATAAYAIIRSSNKKPFHLEIPRSFAGLISAAIFLTSTLWVYQYSGPAGYSIYWALLGFALLLTGMNWKEPAFRVSGFIILALCIANVYLVDVWKLHALLRIGSFITLGGVLIIAGYLYCRKKPSDSQFP